MLNGRRSFKLIFLCEAEDGIRDLVRSRGLGDVYKRQLEGGEGVRQVSEHVVRADTALDAVALQGGHQGRVLSLIHI